MAENSGKTAATEAGSLQGELAQLFGEQVVQRAQSCDVAELDFTPGEIVLAARQLRRLAGQGPAMIEAARTLPDDVQAALCMWLSDTGTKAKLLTARGVCLQ